MRDRKDAQILNVAVISPQILMRRALCALLAQVRDVRVVADFDRAVENCEALQKTQADLLVIDRSNRCGISKPLRIFASCFPASASCFFQTPRTKTSRCGQ